MLKIDFHTPYTKEKFDFRVLLMLKIDFDAPYTQIRIDFKVLFMLSILMHLICNFKDLYLFNNNISINFKK